MVVNRGVAKPFYGVTKSDKSKHLSHTVPAYTTIFHGINYNWGKKRIQIRFGGRTIQKVENHCLIQYINIDFLEIRTDKAELNVY